MNIYKYSHSIGFFLLSFYLAGQYLFLYDCGSSSSVTTHSQWSSPNPYFPSSTNILWEITWCYEMREGVAKPRTPPNFQYPAYLLRLFLLHPDRILQTTLATLLEQLGTHHHMQTVIKITCQDATPKLAVSTTSRMITKASQVEQMLLPQTFPGSKIFKRVMSYDGRINA